MAAIYNQAAGYFATGEQDLSETSPFAAVHLHQQLQSLGIKGGRLLDVGCALGSFIYHMQKLGWEVEGIDINADAVKVARQNHLSAHIEEIQTSNFPSGSFDVIRMGDVIEHGRSPRQMLVAARYLLKSGGLLVIRTPNAKSSFATATLSMAKFLRFPWPHSEAPYHLYEFTPKALTLAVTSMGFEVVRLDISGRVYFLYKIGASGFFDQLKIELKRNGKYKVRWKLFPNLPKLVAVAGLLLPFYIYALFMDQLKGTGDNLFLVARVLK
jgi:2-polyprenyl-3-methyl-5-hydroxy-6-metoxy-1,4-benzoquinol methylase